MKNKMSLIMVLSKINFDQSFPWIAGGKSSKLVLLGRLRHRPEDAKRRVGVVIVKPRGERGGGGNDDDCGRGGCLVLNVEGR